jgi:hypothetical protein
MNGNLSKFLGTKDKYGSLTKQPTLRPFKPQSVTRQDKPKSIDQKPFTAKLEVKDVFKKTNLLFSKGQTKQTHSYLTPYQKISKLEQEIVTLKKVS